MSDFPNSFPSVEISGSGWMEDRDLFFDDSSPLSFTQDEDDLLGDNFLNRPTSPLYDDESLSGLATLEELLEEKQSGTTVNSPPPPPSLVSEPSPSTMVPTISNDLTPSTGNNVFFTESTNSETFDVQVKKPAKRSKKAKSAAPPPPPHRPYDKEDFDEEGFQNSALGYAINQANKLKSKRTRKAKLWLDDPTTASSLPTKRVFQSQQQAKQARRGSSTTVASPRSRPLDLVPIDENKPCLATGLSGPVGGIPCFRHYPKGTLMRHHFVGGKVVLISEHDFVMLAKEVKLDRLSKYRREQKMAWCYPDVSSALEAQCHIEQARAVRRQQAQAAKEQEQRRNHDIWLLQQQEEQRLRQALAQSNEEQETLALREERQNEETERSLVEPSLSNDVDEFRQDDDFLEIIDQLCCGV